MTPAEIKSLYPSLDGLADAVIQAQIDLFGLMYKGDYGDLRDHLLGLYVAHQVTVFSVTSSADAPKTVTSRTVDNMSWSYSESKGGASDSEFGATKYGIEFNRLMSLFGKGPIMSGAVK